MRFKRTLIAGALFGAFATGAVLAQAVIHQNLTGNECWNAGEGPGGPGSYLCADVLRNSMQKVVTLPGGTLTFGSGTLAALRYGGNVLMPTQPVLVTTLVAPPNPVQDGAIIGMCNASGSNFATTNIAMVANTGQAFNTAATTTTLAAVTCILYQFNRANLAWYRLQ